MTPSDGESLPEADCEILERERENVEGHVYVNSFPWELSWYTVGRRGRGTGQRKREIDTQEWGDRNFWGLYRRDTSVRMWKLEGLQVWRGREHREEGK